MQLQDIESLIEALSHKSNFLRETAIRALISIGIPSILPIITAFKDKWMYTNSWGGIEVLCKLGEPSIKPLINALSYDEKYVRFMASETLYQMGDVAIPDLLKILEEGDVYQRYEADTILTKHLAEEFNGAPLFKDFLQQCREDGN
jgi:HEAT repeat protein